MTAPTFLLGCFEIPGWGGAATVSYALFERMQRDGFAVHYVNLVRQEEAAMLAEAFGAAAGNPAGLADVHTLLLADPLWRAHAELTALIETLRPDLLVARGFVAAALMARAAPDVPLAFLTSGCAQVKRLLHAGVIDDFVDFRRLVARGARFTAPRRDAEAGAVAHSDLIVLHSPLVREAFEHFFPSDMGRVYAPLVSVADDVLHDAAPYRSLAQPFAVRDIDVLVVASNWQRPEKNAALLRRIGATCGDLRLHVVGANAPADMVAQHHGIVADRAAIYALLGRAKVLVCPSSWDPAPGVLFEASLMGCNVVASPNCGNWELCDEQLLARTSDAFVPCLRRALAAPLPDHRARFHGGYADLLETLQAFV